MAGFRSGWPGSFQLEPLDRYGQTERKRASSLIKMTLAKKQEELRRRQASGLNLAPVPEPTEKKGGGGAWAKFKGGLDAVTPDALEAPAKTLGTGALKTLGAAQEYAGAPLMGLTSGRLGAEQQTLPDGTTFRAGSPSWSDFGRGLKKAVTQDPRDTYQESRQAFKEGQRDPDLPAWKRVATEALSDPLTYVTPGAAAAVTKALPAGLQASRGARFAGAILADPGRTAAGSVVGSSAAAEVAKRTGLPELPSVILGGVAGGIAAAPGNLGRAGRAIDAATDAQERMLPPSRFGSSELGGMEPLPSKRLTKAQQKLSIPEQRALLGKPPDSNQTGYLTWIDENNRINAAEAATPEWKAANRETITPTDDPVVGKDINGLDVHERASDGLRYTVRDGRARTGVAMAEDMDELGAITDPRSPRKPATPPIETAAPSAALPPAVESAVPPAAGTAEIPAAGTPPRRITAEELVPALQRRIDETRPPGAIPPPPPVPEKVDLFDTIGRNSRLREEERFLNTKRGKLDTGIRSIVAKVGGEKFDRNLKPSDAKTFVVKERDRIDTIRGSLEAHADDVYVRATADLPITKDPDGVNRMPNGASFEDMFERATPEGRAAYDALSPAQKAGLAEMEAFGEELNANLRYHNKTGRLPWDESEKAYFPRTSVGVDGKKRAYVGSGDGKSLGGKKSYAQERTFQESFEEGLKEGIDYADSRQSWRAMTRAKLKAAESDAIISRIAPMGLTKKQIADPRAIGTEYVAIPRDIAPQLSNRYFPVEVAEQITKALTDNPAFHVRALTEFNKVATPLRAMADVSFILQQGSPLIFRYPQKVPAAVVRVIASTKNRKVYDDLIASVDGFNKREAIEHGLIWGSDDLPSTDFALRKAGTEGRITSKPGVKQGLQAYNKVADFSNETFYRYMNYTKANFVADAQKRLEAMKGSMSPEEWRKEYQGAMNAINRLAGQTGRKTSSIESMSLFAPRYFSAAVEQLNAAVSRGGLEGSIARAHTGRMLAFGAAMVLGVNELRGYETELDPRSSNFLRFRDVGGLDVSPFGTYDTLFRALAGTAAGDPGDEGNFGDYTKLWKLAEGKMSPGLKLVYEPFIKKANYRGEPYDPGSFGGLADIAGDQVLSALPFSVQNAVTEGVAPAIGERSLEPIKDALPGIIASGGGATNSPVTPTENRNWRRDEVAQEKFGMKYDELSGRDKSIVNEDEKVASYQGEADKNIETLMDDRSVNQRATIEANSKLEALSQRLENKEIPGSEFRKNYRDIQQQQRGVRSVLEQMEGDKDVEGYFNVFTMAEREDGSIDYELLDQLLPEFIAKHPGVEGKVDKITGTKDNATLRRFRVAQQQARDYYALPAYRGLSADEGKRAQPVLVIARRLVNNGQASGYKHALTEMLRAGAISRDDMILALKAQKLGTSPERKQFKLTHPEYAEFYGDAVLDDNYAEVGTYSGGSPGRKSMRSLSGSNIVKLPSPPKVGLSLPAIG